MDEKEETTGQSPGILRRSDSTGDSFPLRKLKKSKSFKKDRKVSEDAEPSVTEENVPHGLLNVPEEILVSNREIIVGNVIGSNDDINFNDKLLTQSRILDPSLLLSLPLGSHQSFLPVTSLAVGDTKGRERSSEGSNIRL